MISPQTYQKLVIGILSMTKFVVCVAASDRKPCCSRELDILRHTDDLPSMFFENGSLPPSGWLQVKSLALWCCEICFRSPFWHLGSTLRGKKGQCDSDTHKQLGCIPRHNQQDHSLSLHEDKLGYLLKWKLPWCFAWHLWHWYHTYGTPKGDWVVFGVPMDFTEVLQR